MNVTTAVIDNYKARVAKLYSTSSDARTRSVREADYRRSVELNSISSSSSLCPVQKKRTPSSSSTKLKTELGKQFFNMNTVKVASCTFGGVYYNFPDSPLSIQEAVNEYFTNPKQIGSESVYGYAILEGFNGADGMLISKTPRREGRDDLEHELYVTLNGTNKMRELGVPNYAIVYGGYKCSKAIIDPETKKVVQQCSAGVKGSVPYTLYENISPGITASDYIKKASASGIVMMYAQFVLAVAAAFEAIGFTHYDAHTDNYILRDAPSKMFQLKYKIGDIDYYVPASTVGTFIDYGMSVIRNPSKDEYVGSPEPYLEKMLIHGDRPNSLHDPYKFLMFTLMGLSERKDKEGVLAYRALSKVFSFFNKTEDVATVIDKQWKYRYSIPLHESFTVYNLISYLLKDVMFKRMISTSKHAGIQLLECSRCWSFNALSRYIAAEPNATSALSLAEYYDMYSSSQGPYPSFDYSRSKTRHLDRMRELISTGRQLKILTSSVSRPLMSAEMEAECMRNQINVFALLGVIDKLLLYSRVSEWFVVLRKDKDLSAATNALLLSVDSLKIKLCKGISVQKDIARMLRDEDLSEYKWYSSEGVRDIELIDEKYYCKNVGLRSSSDAITLYPKNRQTVLNK